MPNLHSNNCRPKLAKIMSYIILKNHTPQIGAHKSPK